MRVLNHRTKPKMFKKKIPTCDWFVLDLLGAAMAGTLDEVESVVRQVRETHNAGGKDVKEQTIVLVSSVLTWSQTQRKMKKGKDEEEESDCEDGVHYFTDKDFQIRAPSLKYQQIKSIEALAMAAQRSSRLLRVFVVCAGLPYGNGEDLFYEFFRSAWLSLHPDLASLPIVGKGNNRIPTIHVQDLAKSIKYVISMPAVAP